MKKLNSQFVVNKFNRGGQGQGLVEYALLIALVGLVTIFGLTVFGGSVKGGLIKVCAALGNNDCETVQEAVIKPSVTPTLQVSMTPTLIPTATATLVEPDPTRPPVVSIPTLVPTPTGELLTLRIKVVVKVKGEDKDAGGIKAVVYDSTGKYITEGVTDEKGNASFSVVAGEYTVATFYKNVWQKAHSQ